ncbi:MAG: NADH-quinone oxidoreductase subunit NuoB [Candidatus Omnitrophica bacterium]|nr:NADH-quinone oxidoreductase subunit NuoB [Candidatus Omnitrophota bacterium]
MLRTFIARMQQGFQTISFPSDAVKLPERFRGRPDIISVGCPPDCRKCQQACPTQAVYVKGRRLSLDLGKCLFCGACEKVCPKGSIRFSQDYQLAVRKRSDLVLSNAFLMQAKALDKKMKKIFGRSLKLRQVSAGGCNACEQDTNVLNIVVFDLGRFGVQFVASPRHADGILITGPVTENMRLALEKTYEAIPSPKLVIAVGACAISGGPYMDHSQTHNGVDSILPVDLYIPGCPPHPLTILDGLLKLLGKIEK